MLNNVQSFEIDVASGGQAERVFPCRCGATHRGDYAAYDFAHHECFHDSVLSRLDEESATCPDCGKVFELEAEVMKTRRKFPVTPEKERRDE